MRITNLRQMLCLLATSMLIISSCQKEEEIVSGGPAAVPSASLQSNADDGVCGAVMFPDLAARSRMEAMENRVQQFISQNPDAVQSGSRTVVTVPVVFHVVYSSPEQNLSDQ